VPTVKDGGRQGSNTICRYLCTARNGERLYPAAPAAHPCGALDGLAALGVGPPMGILLFGLIRTKPEQRDQAAIEAARRKASLPE
jgi:glutathione S-transferase